MKMDIATIINGNMKHRGNKQGIVQYLPNKFPHISLWELNQYESTQSNLSDGW